LPQEQQKQVWALARHTMATRQLQIIGMLICTQTSLGMSKNIQIIGAMKEIENESHTATNSNH